MTIIVIAYNRVEELSTLLSSLSKAYYDDNKVDLIISIDYAGSDAVIKMADSFIWNYGKKTIIEHKERLGLRNHVLYCGDLTSTIGDIILLEDDLFVSPYFYRYSKESIEFYRNDINIAGISLYNYNINEYTKLRPFRPLLDESDIYFMKIPSSWGQLWTSTQWYSFRSWYNNNLTLDKYLGKVPNKVLNWSDASWKKYFAVYLAITNKYFVYPKIALSTNMGAVGTHNSVNMNNYQAELVNSFERKFIFKKIFNKDAIMYDSFFENENIQLFLEKYYKKVIIDYYGTREDYSDYKFVLSTKRLNYKIIKQWGLILKPYELNIFNNIDGEGLYLYKLDSIIINRKKMYYNKLIKFEIPYITKERAFLVFINDYLTAILRKIKMIFRKIH